MGKKRISLTIDEDLLKKIDRLIGEIGENRSKVFEVLLEKAIAQEMPKQGVILIGGKEKISLQNFGGKMVIENQIEMLKSAGVNEIFVVGKNLKEIKEKVGGVTFYEDKGKGTGAALKEIKNRLYNTFILIYGDNLASVDLRDMYRFHVKQKAMLTMALKPTKNPSKYGVTELKGTKVVKFEEKPKKTENLLVTVGVYIIEPEVLELIPEGECSLERDIIPKLVAIEQVFGYVFSGFWKDLG